MYYTVIVTDLIRKSLKKIRSFSYFVKIERRNIRSSIERVIEEEKNLLCMMFHLNHKWVFIVYMQR